MKKPVVDYTKLRLSNITSKEYRHLLLLLGWVAYFLMYLVTENFIPVSKCHVVHCFIDDLIPFNDYFVIFYVSWYIFMVLSLLVFVLYDIKSFVRAQKLIIGMQIIAVITYIVWPSVQNLRPDTFERDNVLTRLLGFIYSVDTPTGMSIPSCGLYSCRALCLDCQKRYKALAKDLYNSLGTYDMHIGMLCKTAFICRCVCSIYTLSIFGIDFV